MIHILVHYIFDVFTHMFIRLPIFSSTWATVSSPPGHQRLWSFPGSKKVLKPMDFWIGSTQQLVMLFYFFSMSWIYDVCTMHFFFLRGSREPGCLAILKMAQELGEFMVPKWGIWPWFLRGYWNGWNQIRKLEHNDSAIILFGRNNHADWLFPPSGPLSNHWEG